MLRRDGREMELRLPGGRLPRFVDGGMAHGVHRRQECRENEEQPPCRAALLPPGTRRPAREDSHQLRPRSVGVGACDRSLDPVDKSQRLRGYFFVERNSFRFFPFRWFRLSEQIERRGRNGMNSVLRLPGYGSFELCCAELCRIAGRSKGLLVVSREMPIRFNSPAGPRPAAGTI